MSELTAEVRVVIHAHDQPAATMDHGELAIRITGSDELVVFLDPKQAGPWLRLLEATVLEALA